MGWVKGSDRNFEASQTERYRKTKKDRRERRETSGGGPKIRVRGRGSSTCAPGSGPFVLQGETSKGRERESECHCFLRKMLREGTAREGTARDTYSKYDKPDQVRMHLHGLLLSVPVMFEVCETRCK